MTTQTDYTQETAAIRAMAEAHNALLMNREVNAYETQELRKAIAQLAKNIVVKAETVAFPKE